MNRLTSFATILFTASVLFVTAPAAPAQPGVLLADLLRQGLAVDCADCGRLLIATHHNLDVLQLESGTVDLTSERQDDLIGFTPHPDRYAKARWLIRKAGSLLFGPPERSMGV